jgi:threonylcarbamoyladenosine tRNA methylthiotransferase MtaB
MEDCNDPSAADLAVVNSCTVTEESEIKLRRFVRRLARRPNGRGPIETVVMGCAAARDDGTLRALPSVSAVVAGADTAAVLQAAGFATPRVDPVLRRFGSNHRGWLKIQDGCDEHCSFCATTLARGANRSRPIPELVEEARALSQHHAELLRSYQDRRISSRPGRGPGVGPKGLPLAPPRAGARGQSSLGELLEALITAVPSVRFRLSSIEATEIDDTLARLLIEEPRRLAPYLHAPLQSGSNRVLRRMGRHWYTAESYRARLDWLAERLPVFGLGADVIAGFPGETDADHQETMTLLRALPFTALHVFPYSPRPDTAATRLGDDVPAGAIRVRAAELRTLGEERRGPTVPAGLAPWPTAYSSGRGWAGGRAHRGLSLGVHSRRTLGWRAPIPR